jgi:transposase
MAKFSAEDKLAAVQRYLQSKGSNRTIGDSIGAHSSLVKTWMRQYEKNGVEALRKRGVHP